MFQNRKIRFAIIGCGRIFPKHYEIFEKKFFKNFQLTSICEKNSFVFKKIKKKKSNSINFYYDYKNLLKNENIDIAIILTESGKHYKIAKFFLENKVNVIVEKPLCLKINQAKSILN